MMKKTKKSKVDRFNTYFAVVRFAIAILIAFIISFIIMSFSSSNSLAAIGNLFIGPLTTVRRFSTVLETAIPLTFAGLATCVMFKANQFNMAAEGGFFLGALGAAITAIFMPGPPILVIIVAMLVAGMITVQRWSQSGATDPENKTSFWNCDCCGLCCHYLCVYV